MIWLTADAHFVHTAALRFGTRPWTTVEEMDEALIANWNERVSPRDEVWYLGDFSFRDPTKYWLRLHGRIHLLWGNHDHRWKKELTALATSVGDVHFLRANRRKFFLSHYAHRTWPQSNYGSYHCYGHSHGDLPSLGRSMDVGVDANNYYPVELEEVVQQLCPFGATYHHNSTEERNPHQDAAWNGMPPNG